MSSAADFPYNPRLRIEMQVGLDRLKCIKDRALAAVLYDLYFYAERNSSDPRMREQLQREAEDQERQKLEAVANSALTGKLGKDAQVIAEEILHDRSGWGGPKRRRDLPSLREFDRELTALRRKQRGAP